MANVKSIQRYRQIARASEIRAAAAKQGLEVPDRFPRAGDMVHMLFKDERDIGSMAALRAVTVTNCDFSGRIYGWLWNDPANPLYITGRDGKPVPAPALLDVQGIPYDPAGDKPNHWSYMKGALGPGDLPPLRDEEASDEGEVSEASEASEESTTAEGSSEGDNAPEPPAAA